MGKVPQGATVQGPTGIREKGPSPPWPWTTSPWRVRYPGAERPSAVGPTASSTRYLRAKHHCSEIGLVHSYYVSCIS